MSELYTAGYTKNPDYNSLIKLWKRMGHSATRETLEDLRILSEESPDKFKEYYNQWVYASDTYGGKSKTQDIARNFDKVRGQYEYNRAREEQGLAPLEIRSLDWDPGKYDDTGNEALSAWYQENGYVPKGMQVYDFTGFKDEYARKKAERADALENEAQAAKIRADRNQYAARQSPAAQPIQAASLKDALDQAVYGNPAAQQQLKPKSFMDQISDSITASNKGNERIAELGADYLASTVQPPKDQIKLDGAWKQISDSILAGVHGQEQMDRYTASGMTLPSALVKEGLAGAQSVVFGTPYQFGIKPDAQEGFTARPFIGLYMTQLEELAKRDPLRGLNSQNLSQFQIMHDWLAETPAAQTILGAIGEIAVDPLTYIGADTIMGIADAVKAGKTVQALTILKDVEAAAQAERAASAGTRALDTATDIARGADDTFALKLGDDISPLTKEGNPGAKVEDIIETNGGKTPGADGGKVPEGMENAWYKADGSLNPPPNYGAVKGTEKIISLQPGSKLGRFGTYGKSSDFVTAPNSAAETLSLPPYTDISIYQEFTVLKPISGVTQSTVAPWGGSFGGGIQYRLPMTIEDLLLNGYIRK